jgi:hypothetical protein
VQSQTELLYIMLTDSATGGCRFCASVVPNRSESPVLPAGVILLSLLGHCPPDALHRAAPDFQLACGFENAFTGGQ